MPPPIPMPTVAAGGNFISQETLLTRKFTITFMENLLSAENSFWTPQDPQMFQGKTVETVGGERHGDISHAIIRKMKILGVTSNAPVSLGLTNAVANSNAARGNGYGNGPRNCFTILPDCSKYFAPGKEPVIEDFVPKDEEREYWNRYGNLSSNNHQQSLEVWSPSTPGGPDDLVLLSAQHPLLVLVGKNKDRQADQVLEGAYTAGFKKQSDGSVHTTKEQYDKWMTELVTKSPTPRWVDLSPGKWGFRLTRPGGENWDDPRKVPGVIVNSDGSISNDAIIYAENVLKSQFEVTIVVEMSWWLSPDHKMTRAAADRYQLEQQQQRNSTTGL